MVPDHLPRADLRRLGERDLIVIPGCLHEALLPVLRVPRGTFHHESHAVDEPHLRPDPLRKLQFCRLLRDKLRFRCHDRLSRGALGKLIPGLGFLLAVREVREHEKLHKPLDKCGFSGAHGSHDTHIDLSARPRLDIFVYMEMLHKNTPSHILLQCMRKGDILCRQCLFLRRGAATCRLLHGYVLFYSHGRSLCSMRLSRSIRSATASFADFPSNRTWLTSSTIGMETLYFFARVLAAFAE